MTEKEAAIKRLKRRLVNLEDHLRRARTAFVREDLEGWIAKTKQTLAALEDKPCAS